MFAGLQDQSMSFDLWAVENNRNLIISMISDFIMGLLFLLGDPQQSFLNFLPLHR